MGNLVAGRSRNYDTKMEIQNGCVGYLRTYVIYSSMFWGQRNVCRYGGNATTNRWMVAIENNILYYMLPTVCLIISDTH